MKRRLAGDERQDATRKASSAACPRRAPRGSARERRGPSGGEPRRRRRRSRGRRRPRRRRRRAKPAPARKPAPGPRRRARAARVDGARPHRRAAAGVDDLAARAAPSSSPPPSRRPASWPRSASRSAARCSSARSTSSRSPSAATFPRAESPGYQPGERGTQCGSVVRGGESAGLPAVALLSLREPVSSPRRQRRKPMRTLTTRIAVLIAAFAVISPSRARAGAVRRRRGAAPAAPAPFRLSGGGNALLGKKVRFRGTVDDEARRPPGRRPGLRPHHRGVDQAGARPRSSPTARSSHAGRRASIGQFRTRALIGGERPRRRGVARAHAHRLPRRDRHLVRPRLLRQQDRLRPRADRDARRRRPPHAAVRHHRRRPLRLEDDPRPGRRPRPVRRQGEVGPHEGRRGPARLHRRPTASAR